MNIMYIFRRSDSEVGMKQTTKTKLKCVPLLAILSAALLIATGCGGSAGSKLPAKANGVTPQVLRGADADPLKLTFDKRYGALNVGLRLDEGARQRLGAKALPTDAASVNLTISGTSLPASIPVTIYAEEFVNSVAQFVITNLPSGTISVSATVKDASDTTLAFGSQDATIVVGQVTPLNLLLSTSSSTGTGSVSLLVDTRPSAAPSPSSSIPPSPDVPSNGTLTAVVSGNLGPQVVLMAPTVGAVGDTVTLSGSGFHRTPGLSTISFNGTSASTYTAFTTDSSTAALWHMDTSGQTATDSTSNGNNGTVSGTTTSEGRMGSARTLNGSADTISVPNASSLAFSNGITIEAWIKPADLTTITSTDTSPDAIRHILRQAGSNTKQLRFQYNTSTQQLTVAFGLTINGTYRELDATNTVVGQWIDNGWHYIAATYDNTTMRLFRDGVQLGSYTVPSAPQALTAETGTWQIGSKSGTDQFFNGSIDEMRISKVDRYSYSSTNAVVAHWNANQNWSDVQVKVKVPSGVTGSNIPVKIQVGNIISNTMSFSVQ